MRTVAVNLLWLEPGVVGGSEEYTVGLINAVDRIDPDDIELRLFARRSVIDAHPALADRFEIISPPTGLASKAARVATEASWLSVACRNDDLVHHAGGVAPLTSPTPFVLTLLDLQPFDLPDNFSALKRRWFAAMVPSSVRRASRIVTMSRFVADGVRTRFDVDEARISIVPHGIDPTAAGPTTSSKDRELTATYGRYLLYPAIAYPHKRHVDLVDALGRLGPEHGDVSLVLTGRAGGETPAVAERARALGVEDRVHQLGRVPGSELDALYRSATAMVFPSVYEGFGLPLLEAMARGCPVIATDAAAIPEVVGDAGLVVAPASPDALARAIERVLTEDGLRADLTARGRSRAAEFGWRAAGLSLLDAYRGALASRAPS